MVWSKRSSGQALFRRRIAGSAARSLRPKSLRVGAAGGCEARSKEQWSMDLQPATDVMAGSGLRMSIQTSRLEPRALDR